MVKILFSVIALFLLTGAVNKKDQAEDDCTLSATSIIGSYKLMSAYMQTGGQTQADVFNKYQACLKDDVLNFSANNVYSYQDLGIVCTEPMDDTGTWILSGNALSIISKADSDTGKLIITSFDCNKFSASVTEDDVVYTMTYIRL